LSGLWHSPARPHPRFWKVTRFTIRVAWCLILIHVIEIAVWALVFWWQKCLPDAESSFYFAGVTYTTVGYGDLVLPKEWRLFGPLEGLTGILMCGLSTAFFFAVLTKRFAIWSGGSRTGSQAVKSDTRRGFDSPHPLFPLVSGKVAPISSASARSAPTEAGS
jgi:hypothetical protein